MGVVLPQISAENLILFVAPYGDSKGSIDIWRDPEQLSAENDYQQNRNARSTGISAQESAFNTGSVYRLHKNHRTDSGTNTWPHQ